MNTRRFGRSLGRLAQALFVAALASCGGEQPSGTTHGVEGLQATANKVKVTPAIEAKLAAADALDGVADKVIGKCASCSLSMDGSAEHTLKVGEYTLRFCSEHCAESLARDIENKILALKIPPK